MNLKISNEFGNRNEQTLVSIEIEQERIYHALFAGRLEGTIRMNKRCCGYILELFQLLQLLIEMQKLKARNDSHFFLNKKNQQ